MLALAANLDSWQLWWRHNKYSFIRLDEGPLARGAVTLAGAPVEAAAGSRIEPGIVSSRILPALTAALEDEDERLQREAMIALARLTQEPGAGAELAQHFSAQLAAPRQSVSETAVVCLGLLADHQSARVLVSLLRESEAGCRALGRTRVPLRVRALAAVSLGLAARRADSTLVTEYAAHHLGALLGSDECRGADLQGACVLALGQLPLLARDQHAVDGGSHALRAQRLIDMFVSPRVDRAYRRAIPSALVNMAAELPLLKERVAEVLLRYADKRREKDDAVRDSIFCALGVLGDADGDEVDLEIRRSLISALKGTRSIARNYAALSLAQVGGRPGNGEGEAFEGVDVVTQALSKALVNGKSRQRPWVGLALGVLGWNLDRCDEQMASSSMNALAAVLARTSSPEDAGAYCLGAGLAGCVDGIGSIVRDLDKARDDMIRAEIALSIGFMGRASGNKILSNLMGGLGAHPDILEQAAIARRLLGDRELVPDLLASLSKAKAWYEVTGIVRSLAWTSDSRAVDPLLALLADEGRSAYARAAVVRALGRMADESPLPADMSLARGLNLTAAPSVVTDPTGFGVLDML